MMRRVSIFSDGTIQRTAMVVEMVAKIVSKSVSDLGAKEFVYEDDG